MWSFYLLILHQSVPWMFSVLVVWWLGLVRPFGIPWTVAHQGPVHGIFQARILDWVAVSFWRGFSWPRDRSPIFCLTGGFFITEPPGKPICSYHPLYPHSASSLAQTSTDFHLTLHRRNPLCARVIDLQINHIILWLKSSLKKTTACSLPASSALAGCFTQLSLRSWCFSPLSLLGCIFRFSRCKSDVLSLSDLGVPLLYLTPPMAVVTLHLFFNLKTFWWCWGR